MSKKKVIYNIQYGGYGLSKLAAIWLAGRGLEEAIRYLAEDTKEGLVGEFDFYANSLSRHSSLLVECVEALGEKSFGAYASLKIAEVEDLYRIDEYDGCESVIEPKDVAYVSAINDPEVRPREDWDWEHREKLREESK